MGAVHKYDLTPDATHLIVGDYNTPKYKYVARERPDVEPMAVEWIEKIRDLWVNDQEIDFEALQREYKLPTFHSLRFSMTGCEDRKSISLMWKT
jgi:DNA replication regulator DPB11